MLNNTEREATSIPPTCRTRVVDDKEVPGDRSSGGGSDGGAHPSPVQRTLSSPEFEVGF